MKKEKKPRFPNFPKKITDTEKSLAPSQEDIDKFIRLGGDITVTEDGKFLGWVAIERKPYMEIIHWLDFTSAFVLQAQFNGDLLKKTSHTEQFQTEYLLSKNWKRVMAWSNKAFLGWIDPARLPHTPGSITILATMEAYELQKKREAGK